MKINTFIIWLFITCNSWNLVLSAVCNRDAYNNLPALPAFPTNPITYPFNVLSNQIVQNHWSEMAILARPSTIIPANDLINCPHLNTSNLVDWHDTGIWT